MTEFTRRQLLTTASGVGAAAILAGAVTSTANANAMHGSPDNVKRGAPQQPSTPMSDDPLNVDLLERVTQNLVPPPFVPDHEQIALGAPKVVQVRLVIEEKTMVIDDEGTEIQAMTFNGSVPGPMIVVHQGDYVELTLENPESFRSRRRRIPRSLRRQLRPLDARGRDHVFFGHRSSRLLLAEDLPRTGAGQAVPQQG